MAGLLNLVPRYLPRYGMAPEWTRAVRPLVVVFALIAFLVTWVFDADVDKQSGAYATGVLVLMTSASIAVTISARRRRKAPATLGFGLIAAVFLYTTVLNIIERPDGVRIAGLFILGIMIVSLWSRVGRAFELRTDQVVLDEAATRYLVAAARGSIHIVAHEPDENEEHTLQAKEREERASSYIPDGEPIIFLEVTVSDASDFKSDLHVRGIERDGFEVLLMTSPVVPNSIAALLLHIRDVTGVLPGVYFEWTEGNPVANLFRFLFTGEGEVAPTTREVLRRAEPNRHLRPTVHDA